MANIHDVAQRAGVSIATVSRMLSGENIRNRAAVERAIGELGYRPNASARGLRLGRHHTIAVIVPDISNPYFATLVRGIEERVMTKGFRIIVASSDEQFTAESDVLGGLIDAVDAVAIVPAEASERTRRMLAELGKPVVLIDRTVGENPEFDLVHVDNAGGARMAAEHLLSLGHRRIGIISGRQETLPGQVRHTEFLDVLSAAGVDVKGEDTKIGEFTRAFGHQAACELMDADTGITAVFVGNNTMAQGALLAFHAAGVSIPENLSFLCFDDFDLAELLPAPVTVISRPAIAEGHAAADLLLARIEEADEGERRVFRHMVLPVKLTVRKSCSAPAIH
ncbi:LacI family DNA-binding transcriptional regulator [Arthrobacter sp. HLT1-20]